MRGEIRLANYLFDLEIINYLTEEELSSIVSSEGCGLFEEIFCTYKRSDSENFSEAISLYHKIGKYLLYPIERKLYQILDTKNIEELGIFINYRMIDILSDEDILSLFEPPMELLPAIIKILNNLETQVFKIVEEGLLSEKVENILGKKIRKKLLNIIIEGEVKYDLLWELNLLKHLKKEEEYNLLKQN